MTQYQEKKRLEAIERLHDAKYAIADMAGWNYRDNNDEYKSICNCLEEIEYRINQIAKEIKGE